MDMYSTSISLAGPKKGVVFIRDVVECEVSLPAEFGGIWGKVNPEEIFITSINACLMMSFLFFAEKHRIPITSYDSTASTSFKTFEGKKVLSEITLEVSLSSRAERSKVEETLRLAKQHSPVLNSVSIPVVVHCSINGEESVVL